MTPLLSPKASKRKLAASEVERVARFAPLG